MDKYILCTDFDTPLYRYCMGIQENFIKVSYRDSENSKTFKNITEFKGNKKTTVEGWLGDLNKNREKPFLLKDFTVQNCSNIVLSDEIAKKHLRMYIDELQALDWVKNLKLVVGGKDNFRYKVFKDYKAGRAPKPLRFKAIKDWLCNEFRDIVTISDRSESDDFCSIMGWWGFNTEKYYKSIGAEWNSPVVIGGIDKDLLQIPCKHFNLDKRDKGIIEIDEYSAHYNLCIQILLGDVTDNIRGLPEVNKELQERYVIGKGGIGTVKAKKILAGCDTIECLYREVQEAYRCYYGKEYKEPLNLTYKLVKLMEEKDVIPEFPFDKYKI